MNFIQRVSFLIGNSFKVISTAIPTWREGETYTPETNFYKLIKGGYHQNEIIYACVSKKCNTASQTTLEVKSKGGDKVLENHPLRMLLQNPNPRMSEFDLWYSVFLFLDFAGVAYYEKVRSRAGKVVQLWPMRPDWVKPRQTSGGIPTIYSYEPPGVEPIPFPAEDVLAFSIFDPINQYNGYPPVAVAAGSGDLDNYVTDYLRMIFKEGGVPPGILKTTKNITEAIAQRARAIWKQYYGGYQKWTEPAVLGNDMSYEKTGLGIQEMGLEILDERAEVRICMTLHVPPTVIHSSIGMKRAILENAKQFEASWWHDDLIPMYKNLNDTLANQLVPDFGQDIYTEWNFDDVPALREEMEVVKKNALEAFRAGAITRNQYNEICKLPDLGPRGDVYLMSAAMIEVPAGALILTTPKPEPEEEEEPPEEEEPEDETEEEPEEAASLRNGASQRKEAANAPDDDQRREIEDDILAKTNEYMQAQLVQIESSLKELYGDRENAA